MKTVTEIKAQQKNPTRCNIYLDGAYYCALELETVMRHRIKKGSEVEPEFLDEIQSESESLRAFDKALNFISLSKKTKKQIKDYLKGKGYTEKTVEEVMKKLGGYGFTDDEDYSADYVKSYSSKKGKRLLEAELKQKGVSEKDMRSALDSITDERESAKKVADKYMKNKERTRENLYKCYRYLISKGFDFDAAKEATINEDNSF